MNRTLSSLALSALILGCASESGDPRPALVPLDRYRARIRVDGAPELAARAVLRRDGSGRVVLASRAYTIEGDGVRSWDQYAELALTVRAVAAEADVTTLEIADETLSVVALERPHRSGFANPELALVIQHDSVFSGTIDVELTASETVESVPAHLELAGVLEAVECSGSSEPIALGMLSFECTPGREIGDTFALVFPGE